MKVRALAMGYFGHKRIREGEVFELKPIKVKEKDRKTKKITERLITPEEQFSEIWMEKFNGKAKLNAKQRAKAEAEAEEDADVSDQSEDSDEVI